MLIAVDEEVLEGFEIERKWRNHINNSNMLVMHKDKQALKEKLEIAVKALNTIKQAIEFGFPKRGMKIETPHTMLLSAVEEKAQEALAKIKEIK